MLAAHLGVPDVAYSASVLMGGGVAHCRPPKRRQACGLWRQPPRRFCSDGAPDDARFEAVSGDGRVISLAVSDRSLHPGWAESIAFAASVVELEEGPRVVAATELDPCAIAVGLRRERRGDDFALVWARPGASDAQAPAGRS